MEAGARLSPLPLDRLQRSVDSLRARPWLANAPAAGAELSRVDQDVQMEETLRHRTPLRGTALHAPGFAHVDRLPRYPGRFHARAGDRLFRELEAGELRATAVCDPQSEGASG